MLGACALFSCSRTRPQGQRTVRDEMGHEVRLHSERIRRAVSLASSTTEILFALDAGQTLVGVDSYSNWPKAAERLARVGTQQEPSLEAVVALHPDVVITATSANRQQTVEHLERLGLPVYVTQTETMKELDQTILDLGTLFGREVQAKALVSRIHQGVDALAAQVATQPRVAALLIVWNDPLMVVGPKTYAAELLRLAGGDNVATDAANSYPRYSLERVMRLAPQVLIMGTYGGGAEARDPFAFWRRYPDLPAVRDGRMARLDGDLIFRPGPRVVEAAQALYRALHAGSP